MKNPRSDQTISPWGLSPQQAATLDAMCANGCVKSTAKAMGIAPQTVESHLRLAYHRMDPGPATGGRRLLLLLKWYEWRRVTGPVPVVA